MLLNEDNLKVRAELCLNTQHSIVHNFLFHLFLNEGNGDSNGCAAQNHPRCQGTRRGARRRGALIARQPDG